VLLKSDSDSTHEVDLTGVQKTLLITLYAKALDSRSKHSILHDEKAYEIVKAIDYNFENTAGFGNHNIIVVRAKQIDEWVKEFLKTHPDCTVVNLGCGLDTRVARIRPLFPGVNWFDVDFPEVIKERKAFFSNEEGYQMISSSISESAWLDQLPRNNPATIVADGVFEYLSEGDVKTLLNRLTDHFPSGQISFDVMNTYAIEQGRTRLKKTMGAEHRWAVDDPNAVDVLDSKLRRVDTLSLFASKYISGLEFRYRVMYSLVRLFPNFKNMIRLLRYDF
jgi:O-methyltransferase involved in polyketide biosynthesis